jgi:hypothetical protein
MDAIAFDRRLLIREGWNVVKEVNKEVRLNGVPFAEPEGPVGFERRKARRRDDVGEERKP